MQFAAILAGGSGVRMGNPNKPKQFFYLGDKPILVHTLEKFCAAGCFDGILVLTPATWVQQTKDIIARHCPQYADAVNVIAGGAERNDTIMNAIRYFEDECQADDASIIVTHDAVRPFVSLRIIEDNIAAALAHGACDTVVPATDTIVESLDGELISSIPNRSVLYQGQTPQSFNCAKRWSRSLLKRAPFSLMLARLSFCAARRWLWCAATCRTSRSPIRRICAWQKRCWRPSRC